MLYISRTVNNASVVMSIILTEVTPEYVTPNVLEITASIVGPGGETTSTRSEQVN